VAGRTRPRGRTSGEIRGADRRGGQGPELRTFHREPRSRARLTRAGPCPHLAGTRRLRCAP
jgi:hypothetical protein